MNALRLFAAYMLVAPIVGTGTALAAEKIGVRLNWIPGTEHSYLYLGKEKGWYADAGIDLDIIAGQGSTVAVKTVGAGETQFAIADVASVARGWEADVPLVVAAVLLKESPASIYSFKSKGIAKIGDVCGRKVGVNIKSTTTEQYRAMVREAGLKDCKIEEVPVSGGGSKDLLAGTVDAAVTFSYEDPLQLAVRGNAMNLIIASQFFKLYSLSIITNKDMVAKKRDIVDKFVAVTKKSIVYALAHPDEAKRAFLKTAPEADVAYETAKFDAFMKLVAGEDASGASVGRSDAAGWQASLKTLKDTGILQVSLDPTGRFLPSSE